MQTCPVPTPAPVTAPTVTVGPAAADNARMEPELVLAYGTAVAAVLTASGAAVPMVRTWLEWIETHHQHVNDAGSTPARPDDDAGTPPVLVLPRPRTPQHDLPPVPARRS